MLTVVIRQATPQENDAVQALVQAIADETYGYLFAPSSVPLGTANWTAAWLALSRDERVGVAMTQEEWLSDLWVRRDHRHLGIGTQLLAQAESEVRGRGHETVRLRVVQSNLRAVHFYQGQGWQIQREFAHETYGFVMFEMTKSNRVGAS